MKMVISTSFSCHAFGLRGRARRATRFEDVKNRGGVTDLTILRSALGTHLLEEPLLFVKIGIIIAFAILLIPQQLVKDLDIIGPCWYFYFRSSCNYL